MDDRATSPNDLWTLAELCHRVEEALSVEYPGQANGQIREIPDARTIRYYTTLGLIDRPEKLRGRTALYGSRHLLQLVAIKRLQARGLRLVEIQRELVGLPDAALYRAAAIPPRVAMAPQIASIAGETRPEAPTAAAAEPPPPASRRNRPFWTVAPRAEDAGGDEAKAGVGADRREPAVEAEAPEIEVLRLAADVHIVLSGKRPLRPADAARLRREAAPLLAALRELSAEAPGTCGRDEGPPERPQ